MLSIRGKANPRGGLPRGPHCFPKPMLWELEQLWEPATSSATLDASQRSGCSMKALGELVSNGLSSSGFHRGRNELVYVMDLAFLSLFFPVMVGEILEDLPSSVRAQVPYSHAPPSLVCNALRNVLYAALLTTEVSAKHSCSPSIRDTEPRNSAWLVITDFDFAARTLRNAGNCSPRRQHRSTLCRRKGRSLAVHPAPGKALAHIILQ